MGSFASKLVATAIAEEAAHHGRLEHQTPLKERIGTYWQFFNRQDLDGTDHDVPWSAVFISYMIHLAGAGAAFPYSPQHSVFVYRTINDRLLKKKTAFYGYPAAGFSIEPGDIIHMNRSGKPVIDYDWASHHADYSSHADIVVNVSGGSLEAIGGNVGSAPGQIGRKSFALNKGAWTNPGGTQTVSTVIRSFLP